jgi:hypothetical protein
VLVEVDSQVLSTARPGEQRAAEQIRHRGPSLVILGAMESVGKMGYAWQTKPFLAELDKLIKD